MRWMCLLMCGVCLSAAAVADTVITDVRHFDNAADLDAYVDPGFEFAARGDTDYVRVTQASPLEVVETPYDLWSSGVARGFKAVYNLQGVPTGMVIDDVTASLAQKTPISAATNGLLITAHTDDAANSVSLTNLKLTLPNLMIYNLGDVAFASGGTDYLVAHIDAPIVDGFILSGSAAFSWAGDLPEGATQWFEITPVVIVPEPASGIFMAAGSAALFLLRRR